MIVRGGQWAGMRAKLLDLPPVVTDQERAEDFCDRLEQLLLEVGEVFPRADLRRRAAACVRGLLGPLSRKNGWQISEHAGEASPWGQQHLLDRAVWNADELRDFTRRYVVAGLDDGGAGAGPAGCGVLVVDETGFAKKGEGGLRGQWQYRSLGRRTRRQIPFGLLNNGKLARSRQHLPSQGSSDMIRGGKRGETPP